MGRSALMWEFVELKHDDPERTWIPKFAIWDTVPDLFYTDRMGEQGWESFADFCQANTDPSLRRRLWRLGRHFFESLGETGP